MQRKIKQRDFKPGDVVQLKSGGPRMVIDAISAVQAPPLYCTWFDKDRKCYQGYRFVATSLKYYKQNTR